MTVPVKIYIFKASFVVAKITVKEEGAFTLWTHEASVNDDDGADVARQKQILQDVSHAD